MDEPSRVGPATAVNVRYLTTLAHWEYDPDSGKYLRFTDGSPHTDANTGEQITADKNNVRLDILFDFLDPLDDIQ